MAKGIAIGRLNIDKAEGRDPRLVLDSTICNVNPRCHLPSAADVRLAFHALDDSGQFTAASIDFKAAHKQICVLPEEQGALLFKAKGKNQALRHFGARFSAYWRQRAGECITRLLQLALHHMPQSMWLYVSRPPGSTTQGTSTLAMHSNRRIAMYSQSTNPLEESPLCR